VHTPIKPHGPIAVEIALLGALATLWAASYSFIKLGVETIPPITLIAARTLIAGTLLLGLLRLRGLSMPMDRRHWGMFLTQSLLNSVVPFTLIAWAEQTVDAGLATILNSTSPIFTFLITATMTRHEPATARKLFGVVAGLSGVALIIGVGSLQGVGKQSLAQIAIVAATLCYAGAAIFGRAFAGLDPMITASGSLLSGAVLLVPASLLVEQPWRLAPSPTSVAALLALSVFSTALAFVIYFRLVRTLGSVGTTAQAYLRAPIGVAIAVLLLGERPAPTAWIGLACVIAGVAAMTIPPRAKPTPPS
jgi:drug/metabolite transporter (DMT)-like permease